MHSHLEQHTRDLIQQALIKKSSDTIPTVVLGLSGGPDSVFLLYLLKQLVDQGLIKLYAAHLNHGWRASAGIDEQFCRDLCNRLGVPLSIGQADNLTLQRKYNGSKEEVGRHARRSFLEQVCRDNSADLIMLAHHMQDQQETFFIRMLRGASLSGLCGMRAIAGIYVRPLLQTSKEVMLSYLKENNISFCIDESNDSDYFLRNRVRKEVIPALRSCDDRFDITFQRLHEHLQADEDILVQCTQDAYKSLFSMNDSGIMVGSRRVALEINRPLFKRVIVYWLLQEQVSFALSDAFLLEIIRFLQSSDGAAHQLAATWQIVKRKDLFWLEKNVVRMNK